MRAFIALPLKTDTAEILYEKREILRGGFKKIKWVPPVNFHITLFFLGDITHHQAEEICRIMEETTVSFSQFPVELTGPGQFPPKGQPRIIYEGLGKGAAEAKKIYNVLMPYLNDIVKLEKRKYIPHITLGRVQADFANRFISESIIPLEPVTGRIEEMTLFESVLQKTGAEYYPIKQIPLKEDI